MAVTVRVGDCINLLDMDLPSVQLVYIDPPYNTGRRFTDEWIDSWPTTSAFIDWLRPRLKACWDALGPNGNMIVHIDWRTVHYVKVAMDELFGEEKFCNEIIWTYRSGGASKRHLSRKHDTLLWYAKGNGYTFNPQRVPYAAGTDLSRPGFHPEGKLMTDIWDINFLSTTASERTGYPTQKPLTLLTRVIELFSNEGDVVLDAFCGSGTTGVAAAALSRHCVMLDINPTAAWIAEERMLDQQAPPSLFD